MLKSKRPPRVLLLVSNTPDYLEDLIYGGLCELLGSSNVVDFPQKSRYHRGWFPNQRPVTYAYPSASYCLEDLVTLVHIGYFDTVLVGSLRWDAMTYVQPLFKALQCRPLTAFLDGEDQDTLLWQEIDGWIGPGSIDIYFKREYKPWMRSDPRVVPLPFACPDVCMPDVAPDQGKKYDVCWLGFPTSEYRKTLRQKLHSYPMQKLKIFDEWATDRDYVEYSTILAQSKIAVSIEGAGFDTLRYWEIPFWNTLLLSQEPSIVIPDNFIRGTSAVFCKRDLSDLIPLIQHYVHADQEREQIAVAGRTLLLSQHTQKARARFVMEVLASASQGNDSRNGVVDYWLSRTTL